MTSGFKVITFNMANYDDIGNWEQRCDMFANTCIQQDADIILFQEVRFYPDRQSTKISYQDMAQQVLFAMQKKGKYGGATCVSLPVATYPFDVIASYTVPCPASINPLGKGIEWEGLSIISKTWIKETGSLTLTKPGKLSGDLNPRANQYAAIDLSNGKGTEKLVYVFNCHFSYDANDALDNSILTLDYVKRFVTASNGLYLLAGDLNTNPDDAAIKTLSDSGILIDMWPQIWKSQSKGLTFKSDVPTKRIDYIFASPKLASGCTGIFLLGTIPGTNGVYMSDHLGLVASFALPTQEQLDPITRKIMEDFVIL